MLHHDKVVLMRSSDGEDANSTQVMEHFFPCDRFWPFLLLDWKVKTLEISASFERAEGSQRTAVQQKKTPEDEEAHRDRLGAVSS